MTSNQEEVEVRIEDLAVMVLLVDDLVVEDVIHTCAADWLTSSRPTPAARRWAHNL